MLKTGSGFDVRDLNNLWRGIHRRRRILRTFSMDSGLRRNDAVGRE